MIEATEHDLLIDFNGLKLSVRKIFKSFLRILDKEQNEIPFTFNEAQETLFQAVVDQMRNNKPVRFVILKARQMGFSTFIAGLIFILTMFQKNKNAIIVAHVSNAAEQIFKMYKRFYYSLPKELQTDLKSNNARELSSLTYGSTIRVLTQGDGIARGSTLNFVHFSEGAFYENLEDSVLSVSQSLPFTNRETMFFIESTANGFNTFKEYYDDGLKDDSVWKSFFFPWFEEKTYRIPYDGFTLSPFEKKLMADYRLDFDQITWYHMKFLEVKRDLKRMKQENPSRPADAFISTGNSVFDNEAIALRKEVVLRKGYKARGDFTYSLAGSTYQDYFVSNESFEKSSEGNLTIYKYPQVGHHYVIGVDPARGRGIDYTVMQVIDNTSLEQVATYRVTNEDNDISSAKCICLARKYNDALIVPETNSTDSMVKFFQKAGYRKVYIRESDDSSIGENLIQLYGVRTGYNKKTMIDMALEILRESNYNVINDFQTLCEMESFVYEQSSQSERLKARASGHAHDDTVMALLIAYYGRNQEDATILSSQGEINKQYLGFDPLDLNKEENNDSVEEVFSWND